MLNSPISGPIANTWPLSEKELIALCPIDGPLSKVAVPSGRSQAEIELATASEADALRDAGFDNWASMLRGCLERPDPVTRLSYVGHSLAILLHRGPLSHHDLVTQRDLVRQLLVDSVILWPTH